MMGEYADLCLEGEACAGCGELFLDNSAEESPRYCRDCEPDDVRPKPARMKPARVRQFSCPACSRRFFNGFARSQHRAAKEH